WLIEPSVHKIICVSRSKSAARKHEDITRVLPPSERQLLQPIDEFFYFPYLPVRWLKGERPGTPISYASFHSEQNNFDVDKLPLYTAGISVCVWLSAADVKSNLPEEFTDFPDTQVIIDCTEIRCQTPSSPLLQSEIYSNYKSHCTMKGIIGIAPHGPVTFVFQLYAGSKSDREIFKQFGITKRLTEDMAVMVDKGFLISDCVNCKVYCPPFLSRLKQMPAHQVKETQAIARLRVHME
uniref:DDE Tnp4 domain-containing protein n=1 Tax=Cyprinus carpio carpio TaxID=630221 RepID=A0A9J8B8P7_CYPCA